MQQPIRGKNAGDEVGILTDYHEPAPVVLRSKMDQICDKGSINHLLAGIPERIILQGERQMMVPPATESYVTSA